MGWPSTVNFSKDRRVVPALPRPAGAVWAISDAGRIASPATAPIITNRFIAVSSVALAADKVNGLIRAERLPGAAAFWCRVGKSTNTSHGADNANRIAVTLRRRDDASPRSWPFT